MEIGIDSFAAILPDPTTGTPPSGTDRMADLLEEIEIADQVGLDVFGMGEHHRAEFSRLCASNHSCGGRCPHQDDPSYERGYGVERRRPCARVSGVRHPRSHLEGTRRDRRWQGFFRRSLSIVWLR